ncbi:hypothetical protein HGM15179_019014 [Zosterops borbonicus]|uniref:Uncharacterized protein n=1 Tax=Zosterops borbonicus TaxID=364589 RepID=A0A8K1DB88_9PASS|nr:hypothetical protein HGM15179_019013 [Zosterops borbonicus]TRZ08096.1 hypothetical protein HGM15179_019014 [Zosterops borbonicus]
MDNKFCTTADERGVRLCERSNSADTKVSEEGGRGCAAGTEAEIPLQPMVKTIVMQVVSLLPMDIHGGAEVYSAARGGLHDRARGFDQKKVAACRELGKTCDPVERTHAEAVLERLKPVGWIHVGEVHE